MSESIILGYYIRQSCREVLTGNGVWKWYGLEGMGFPRTCVGYRIEELKECQKTIKESVTI